MYIQLNHQQGTIGCSTFGDIVSQIKTFYSPCCFCTVSSHSKECSYFLAPGKQCDPLLFCDTKQYTFMILSNLADLLTTLKQWRNRWREASPLQFQLADSFDMISLYLLHFVLSRKCGSKQARLIDSTKTEPQPKRERSYF